MKKSIKSLELKGQKQVRINKQMEWNYGKLENKNKLQREGKQKWTRNVQRGAGEGNRLKKQGNRQDSVQKLWNQNRKKKKWRSTDAPP